MNLLIHDNCKTPHVEIELGKYYPHDRILFYKVDRNTRAKEDFWRFVMLLITERVHVNQC